jgi:hypothetical protein
MLGLPQFTDIIKFGVAVMSGVGVAVLAYAVMQD